MVVLAAMLLCTTTFRGDVREVDFKLDPPALTSPATARPAIDPLPEAGPADDASVPPMRPHFRLVNGFGHNVPLSFAVRQVVPAHVKVVYDDGVDRAALVSWQGGRPWNDVIRTTAKTIGLHVTLSAGIVRISN